MLSTLAIARNRTVIATGAGPEPGAFISFDMGGLRIARECLHDRFSRPAELEAAILVVEEETMRQRSLQAVPSTLMSVDPVICQISRAVLTDEVQTRAQSLRT